MKWKRFSVVPGALPLAARIEDSFRRQIDALPTQARRLLLVAAADPTGDPALVLLAASRMRWRSTSGLLSDGDKTPKG